MVQFKGIWLSWLIIASVFSTSFIGPNNGLDRKVEELTTQVQELQTQLIQDQTCYEEELGEMREQLATTAKLISDPLNLAEMLYSRKRLQKTIKKEGKFIGTNLVLRHKGIDSRISPELYAAFLDCTGPEVEVNSAKRTCNPNSDHFYGRALDIRYDAAGIAFANWLVSKEGTEWRERFGISFYVEASYSTHPIFRELGGPKLEPFHFVNRRATGPHLHLFVERRNKIEKKNERGSNPDISE